VLDPQARPHRTDVWRRKIMGHIQRLSRMNHRDQLTYIARDVWIRMRRVGIYTLVAGWRIFGQRLPDVLLIAYLRETHQQALLDYVPSGYAGKITLFRARSSLDANPIDSPLGWKPLAGGGLDAYFFDSTHRIVDAEYAAAVGRQLNACLRAARGEEQSR